MSDSQPIELYNLGAFGVISDIRGHLIPPEAWTNARNVMFTDNGVERELGYSQVFGTLSVEPEFIFNAPGNGASYWIYCSLTKAYVYESGTHTNITRQTAGVDVNYTITNGYAWQGTMFGGVPIINNGVDKPQYWTALNPTNKLADLTAWPATLRANLIKSFGSYLMALNLLDNTTRLESAVQLSSKADPGTLPASWDYTDPTVDSVRIQLTDSEGGAIKEALMLGNQMVVYKEYSTHMIRFVGGQNILGADLLLTDSGILAAKCVCAYRKGTRHFVVTADDIITHAGTRDVEHVAEDRVRNKIFSEIDPANYVKSFAFEDSERNRCFFVYCSIGATNPDTAAIWDYKRNTWSFKDWDGNSIDAGSLTESTSETWDAATRLWESENATWSSEERLKIVAVSTANSKAWLQNSGYAFGDTTPVSYLERVELAIDGVDRNKQPKASLSSIKQINRIWPKVVGEVELSVQVGSQERIDGVVTYTSDQHFDPASDRYLDMIAVGPLLCVRFEIQGNIPWSLDGYSLELTKLASL